MTIGHLALVVIYWVSFFLLLYTWIFHLCILGLIKLIRGSQAEKIDYSYSPVVSFIIAAHNEEKTIARRIENLTNLDYPGNLTEIIVVSDGSTDRTDEIVREISRKNDKVILLSFEQQKGRAYVHNESVKRAKGDIVVFTDAETRFERDFLKILIPHFSNDSVGCVSGRLYYKNVNQSSITKSADMYWKYEGLIRRLASDLGVLAFGTGAGLAIRKSAYTPVKITSGTDYAATLSAKLAGYKVKYEPRAKLYDYIEPDAEQSKLARIRKTSRAFKDVLLKLLKINPFKNPIFFISVFFHKTSRHLTPFYMIIILILNIFLLLSGKIYSAIFLCQALFYAFALVGWISENTKKRFALFYIPYNFVLINIGRFMGVLKSIFGLETTTYTSDHKGSEII